MKIMMIIKRKKINHLINKVNKTKEMNENNSGDDKNDKDKDKEKNSEGDSTYRAE